MPNRDGGHYFLTVLAPVRTDTMIDPVVGRTRSHAHLLAQKLALLATGPQTAASPPDGWVSPFSRNTMNHTARFAMIGGPNFNGRFSGDALISLLRGINPLIPQPVDELTTPYLLFAADVDAQHGDEADALAAYAAVLWQTMQPDLAQIFQHCIGFSETGGATGFLAYLKSCQVETTLPFNDYWADGMTLPDTQLPLGPLKVSGLVAIAGAAVWLAAIIANGLVTVTGAKGWFAQQIGLVAGWGVFVLPALFGVAALAVWGVYAWIMRTGAKPFPTAPASDLPSILKGLFLQQAFTRFAIEAQGLDDEVLHARFGAFLGAVKPKAPSPALAPGDCQAPAVEWAR